MVIRQGSDDIAESVAAIQAGKQNAADQAESAIRAHADHSKLANAYRYFDPDNIRLRARTVDAALAAGMAEHGALAGIPVSIKDLIYVRGQGLYAGTPRELPEEWHREGPVVRALNEAGALLTGKTHTVELAFGGVGTNPHWPTPCNPWSTDGPRAPGGSSSGAATSLWEGSARLAIGSDTAGSVRVPASFGGAVGLKTSYGRWSCRGVVPLSTSLDSIGPLALSVRDIASCFAVLDPAWRDQEAERLLRRRIGPGGLRLGIVDWFFRDCASDISASVQGVMGRLERAGAQLIDVAWPELTDTHEVFRTGGIAAAEFAAMLRYRLPEWQASLDPNVGRRFSHIEQMPAPDYVQRRAHIGELALRTADRLRHIDAVLCPTIPISPPSLGMLSDMEAYLQTNFRILSHTAPANLLNLCAISMPCGKDRLGLPVGLMLMAGHGEDEKLLAIAMTIEDLIGDARQILGRPPLFSG